MRGQPELTSNHHTPTGFSVALFILDYGRGGVLQYEATDEIELVATDEVSLGWGNRVSLYLAQ